jgi:hypothetical protein
MTTRIYLVTDNETKRHRLIRAGNQAQAIRHAAQTRFEIEVANQDALVNLLTNGIPVELATGQATADMFEEAAINNPGGTD